MVMGNIKIIEHDNLITRRNMQMEIRETSLVEHTDTDIDEKNPY